MQRFSISDFIRWLRMRWKVRRARLYGTEVTAGDPDFDGDGNPIDYEANRYSGCLLALVLGILIFGAGILFLVCDPFGGGGEVLIGSPTVAPSSTAAPTTAGATTTTTEADDTPPRVRRTIEPLELEPAAIRLQILTDLIADAIDSRSDRETAGRDEIDIVRAMIYAAGVELSAANSTFNDSVYECGAADPLVVCAAEVLDFPEGDLLIVAVEHDGQIPTDSTERSYIYSLVFESDGDPANDWVYNEPFDWDYFQGADRWYQAIYSHDSGDWLVDVTQVAAGNQKTSVPSAVRAVVDGRWIFWFVPADEIPDFPGRLRATAFVHDGFFGEETRAGDVTGTDPTEPLFDVGAAPVG